MAKISIWAGLAAAAILTATLFTSAPAQERKVYRIIGMVFGEGNLQGTKVVACSVPFQECKTKVETPVNPTTSGSGSFTLELPSPGPYQILAWKDVDGDGTSSAGDWLVAANDGNAITAPKMALSMKMFKVSTGLVKEAASNEAVPALAGSWSQRSTTKELVLASKIKFQPSMATGYGTNLGGTFGPGSATNTTLVTESTSVNVQRQMNLQIKADGSFRWAITKSQPEGGCTKTIKQEKLGRVLTKGNQVTFVITAGDESWSSPCGKSGTGRTPRIQETYTFSKNGASLSLKGGGGVNWTFTRS